MPHTIGRTYEQDVQAVRETIIRMAAKTDLDSGVLIAAIADILGLTAATLDVQGNPLPLETRLDDVFTRAKAMHQRTLQRMSLVR